MWRAPVGRKGAGKERRAAEGGGKRRGLGGRWWPGGSRRDRIVFSVPLVARSHVRPETIPLVVIRNSSGRKVE